MLSQRCFRRICRYLQLSLSWPGDLLLQKSYELLRNLERPKIYHRHVVKSNKSLIDKHLTGNRWDWWSGRKTIIERLKVQRASEKVSDQGQEPFTEWTKILPSGLWVSSFGPSCWNVHAGNRGETYHEGGISWPVRWRGSVYVQILHRIEI